MDDYNVDRVCETITDAHKTAAEINMLYGQALSS